jgi:hypothetical protein
VTNTTGRRYPLSKLLDACDCTEAELVRRLAIKGVHFDGTTLKRAREQGLVERAADRYAARLGWVVWHVWPEWLDHIIEDESIPCAECETPFVPKTAQMKYCSRPCGSRKRARESGRKRYAESEEVRARRKLNAKRTSPKGRARALLPSRQWEHRKDREYYARNRDQILAARRARYRRQKDAAA